MKFLTGSSAEAEVEVGALFHNGHEAEPIWITLPKMGHTQPETPITTDNCTTNGIVNNTVLQKQPKAMDMLFYWIQDLIKQDHFHVCCKLDTENLEYYFTKHHPPHHHR